MYCKSCVAPPGECQGKQSLKHSCIFHDSCLTACSMCMGLLPMIQFQSNHASTHTYFSMTCFFSQSESLVSMTIQQHAAIKMTYFFVYIWATILGFATHSFKTIDRSCSTGHKKMETRQTCIVCNFVGIHFSN